MLAESMATSSPTNCPSTALATSFAVKCTPQRYKGGVVRLAVHDGTASRGTFGTLPALAVW